MKVSVIIPVFNAKEYIEKCFNSVINQTYPIWEIIAIDDGSKDDSWDIMKKYALQENRIKVFRQVNSGPGVTRNNALLKSSGDYIVFLDSDDYIENNYFQLLVEKIEKTKADVVFIDLIQENVDGKVIRYEKMSKFSSLDRRDLIGTQMTGKMPWGGVRKAVKKELLKKNEIFFSEDSVGEEAIYSFELLRNSQNVVFIDKPLYHYVNHVNSQSKSGEDDSWGIVAKKLKQHLCELHIEGEYEKAINAFGYAAFISWILNYSRHNSIWSCRKEIRKHFNYFLKEYGWNINKKYLRVEAVWTMLFIHCRLFLPLIFGAKLREIKRVLLIKHD